MCACVWLCVRVRVRVRACVRAWRGVPPRTPLAQAAKTKSTLKVYETLSVSIGI